MIKFINFLKNEKGVTLIELILAISIFMIISLSIHAYYISFYKNLNKAQEESDLVKEWNFISSILSIDIRSAVRPNGYKFPVKIGSNNKILELYRPANNSNKLLYIQYLLNDEGILIRKINKSLNNNFPYNFDSTWDKTTKVADGVTVAPIFFYTDYDEDDRKNYTPQFIKISMELNKNTKRQSFTFKVMSRSRDN